MGEQRTHRRRSRRRTRLRATSFALIAFLYAVSIPWYRETGAPLRLWLGLPDWAAVALVSYALAALVNAWIWHLTDLEDGDDSAGPETP